MLFIMGFYFILKKTKMQIFCLIQKMSIFKQVYKPIYLYSEQEVLPIRHSPDCINLFFKYSSNSDAFTLFAVASA